MVSGLGEVFYNLNLLTKYITRATPTGNDIYQYSRAAEGKSEEINFRDSFKRVSSNWSILSGIKINRRC